MVKLEKIVGNIVILIFIAGIITFTYPLIGLWGQVQPCNYPVSYQSLNNFLQTQNISGHIIYLPWEGYLTYNWTAGCNPDGRIANPINKVVKPVIISSPGKWGGMDDLEKNITECIKKQSIECLKNNSIQYILKDKCAFYPKNYSWIDQPIIYKNKCIDVYEISPKKEIKRSINIPIRFILGSVISVSTVIGICIYFFIDIKNKRKNKKI